jgi:hypothetical protein
MEENVNEKIDKTTRETLFHEDEEVLKLMKILSQMQQTLNVS